MYPSLKGYVRNTGYGEVEVLLQGGQEDIDEMIAWLNHGPGTARVDKLSISKVPVNSEAKKFTIK
jgi:acylphosphatase